MNSWARRVMTKRRVFAAVTVLAIVALVIVIWRHKDRTSARSAQHSGKQNVTSGKQSGGGLAQDLATATRRVAGTVFLDDAPAAGATVRLVQARGATATSVKADAAGH